MEQFPSSSSSQAQRGGGGGGGRELQGPRPAPLKVQKESRKISKKQPPVQVRQPVIIYTVSPKVVHANPSDFMSVVQRLTGAASSTSLPPPPPPPSLPFPFFPQLSSSASTLLPPAPQPQLTFPFQLHAHEGAHQHSPAARLAAVERASLSAARSAGGHPGGGLPPLPSILSPAPGSMEAIPANFFSPPGGGINLFGELISPAFPAGTTAPGAGASPPPLMYYGQLPPPAAPSPSPSAVAYYWDLFNNHTNL